MSGRSRGRGRGWRRGSTGSSAFTKKTKTPSAKSKSHTASKKLVPPKCLFKLNEKVLCYEPDPSKYRVLYEAKILKISNPKSDGKGGLEYQYLIHFLGWNSSWDRYVTEDFILKICDHSRELQEKLKEDALELQNAVKKPSRRKGSRKPVYPKQTKTDPVSHVKTEPGLVVGEDGEIMINEEDEDSSEERERENPPVLLTNEMKAILCTDNQRTVVEMRRTIIPAKPNVVQILEDFVKYYGLEQLSVLNKAKIEKEKSLSKKKSLPNSLSAKGSQVSPSTNKPTTVTKTPEELADELTREELVPLNRDVRLMKEAVDSIRILFDFVALQILLYATEIDQLDQVPSLKPHDPYDTVFRADFPDSFMPELEIKQEPEPEVVVVKKEHRKSMNVPSRSHSARFYPSPQPTRRAPPRSCSNPRNYFETESLPSASAQSSSPIGKEMYNGNFQSDVDSLTRTSYKRITDCFVDDLLAFRLMPSAAYEVESHKKAPSLIYGLPHLMRLFVQLPKILARLSTSQQRLHSISKHVNEVIKYVAEKANYGDHLYEIQPAESPSSSSAVSKGEDDEPPVKRKKGRPRKYPLKGSK